MVKRTADDYFRARGHTVPLPEGLIENKRMLPVNSEKQEDEQGSSNISPDKERTGEHLIATYWG